MLRPFLGRASCPCLTLRHVISARPAAVGLVSRPYQCLRWGDTCLSQGGSIWLTWFSSGTRLKFSRLSVRSLSGKKRALRQLSRPLTKALRKRFGTLFRRQGARKDEPQRVFMGEGISFSARFKKLTREYGWASLGIYLALGALDFPFCFLLVRAVGAQKIGTAEDWVISKVKMVIPNSIEQKWHDYRTALKKIAREKTIDDTVSDGIEMAGWRVEEATEMYKKDASLPTQLALAYAVHKSLIFIRIPLTIVITPKVVKVLRGWGWQIGKGGKP